MLAQIVKRCGVFSLEIVKSLLVMDLSNLLWVFLLGQGLEQVISKYLLPVSPFCDSAIFGAFMLCIAASIFNLSLIILV